MIDILLSTYNGKKYIKDQLNSIISQTYQDWHLIIRDDGSTDSTISILENFIKNYHKKISFLKDKLHLGPIQSFAKLLRHANAEYIMFCDQDDIWLPQKIEKTLNKMLFLEKKYGKNTPILVHTDLKVVDENLNLLSKSFWRYQNLCPEKGKTLNRLLAQNVITGCTVMINKALKELINYIPKTAIMHDWWIALVASAFGKIAYIPQATVLYRQHVQNTIGAKKWNILYIKNQVHQTNILKERIIKTQHQALSFYESYRNFLDDNTKNLVISYANIGNKNFIKKRIFLLRNKIFKQGLTRNMAFFFLI